MTADQPSATGPTRLRDRTDRGLAGDKVPAPDPAAAPLGTDDEAAGARPDDADTDAEHNDARTGFVHRPIAADSGPLRRTASDRTSMVLWVAATGIVCLSALVVGVATLP